MYALELKDISKRFGKESVFENFSLKIEEGEMLGIVGKSGKGKTTLINCMGQLEDIDAGEIFIFGKQAKKRDRKKYFRDTFGFLFQNFALIDNETVFQNLKFLERNREIILSYLEKFELSPEVLDKKVYQLSGGQQQRIALIRVLLKKPKILFADEPTASLDDGNTSIVIQTLKELNASGITIIVVTHNEHLLPYFDRIIELK